MEAFKTKTNDVDITITAPSDNEMDGENSEPDDEENSDFENGSGDHTTTAKQNGDGEKASVSDGDKSPTAAAGERDGELCERFDSGVSLNDEKQSPDPQKNCEKSPQNYEIVGDRVLVERDGKFELVDANEIKAEYFEMLGIKPEGSQEASGNSENSESTVDEKSNGPDSLNIRERPKTTPAFGTRAKDAKTSNQVRKKRVQSSWGDRYRSSEYSKIKSPYGLNEKQLEIKKKREEAIVRRKKEEEARQREEEKQKREDAERAFQAWLNSKREEEKEHRRMASKEENDEDKGRAGESKKAFKAWKAAKKKQEHIERVAATRRMEETASMYVVHDRGSCEEAFTRWLKKKKNEKKAKELDKKKRLSRPKSRRKPKEPLPINSDKIRFTDNYGYRNTVVY